MTRFSRKFYDGGEGGAGGDGGNQQQQQQQQQQQGGTLPQGAFMLDKYADALPEDLRSNPFITTNPNLEALVRSGISARALVGKDPNSLIEMPKPGDADAFRGALTKLGLPADAAKYTVDDKQLPEPFKMGTDFGKAVLASAHKHGILPQSFQGFYSEVAGMLSSTQQQADREKATAREQGFTALQTEWGQAYDTKTAHARLAISKLAGSEEKAAATMEALINAGLDAHSGVMNTLAAAGALLAEDSDVGGGAGGGGFSTNSMTPAEATAKATELVAAADREKDLSKRRQLNDEAQKYFKIASGGKVIK